MPNQSTSRRLVQLLCVLASIALVGATPAVAAEIPGTHGGTLTLCSDYDAAADAGIDAVEAAAPVDAVTAETDFLGQIQALVTQRNFDVTRTGCLG